MEFGALVCKPKNPNCLTCYLKKTCNYFKSNNKISNFRKKMIRNKNYNIFCYINKKKQIALTKNNQISFLKNFNLPRIKETNFPFHNQDWKFLKNYKNTISNLKLNINLYYKFSNKIPSYTWYSLEKNKEFIPSFTKKIFRQVSTLFKWKKLAIIGAGIAGLTLANLLKKNSDFEFMLYEKQESLSLEEGFGIQLSTNSIKILNRIGFDKINNEKIFHPKGVDFLIFKIKKFVI